MRSRVMIAFVLLFPVLVAVSSVSAGRWASVRIVKSDSPLVDVPWNATVVVLQHDRTPVDVERLHAQFVHAESKSVIEADAEKGEKTGQYTLVVTFPESGVWNWTAKPGDFGAFTMASQTVGTSSEQISQDRVVANLVAGTCAVQTLPYTLFPVSWIADAEDRRVGIAIIPRFDNQQKMNLESKSWAMVVTGTAADSGFKACLDIPAFDLAQPTVFANKPDDHNNAQLSLAFVPAADGVQGTLTINPPKVEEQTVRILSERGGLFSPSVIEIAAGTTVTWINDSDMGHTVTSLEPENKSSGMIDPGQAFTQTFLTPGTFHYRCDPHSWMTGVIVVT